MTDHSRLLAGDANDRRLTAGEVRATVFPPAGFARGLNAEQVSRFMSRVAWELELLAGERADLEEENRSLQLQMTTRQAPVSDNGSSELQAVHVLQRAQQNADNLVASAQQQAQNMMQDGRQQRERMLADGHQQRQRTIQQGVEEAGREAARIAAQAPIEAQRALAQYRALAESVRASMSANLQTLIAQVNVWEDQERQNTALLTQRVPPGQPAPTLPLA